MMYDVIGMNIEDAKEYFRRINKKAVFVETKDVKNVYSNKRVVRIKTAVDSPDVYEVLYTGFPILEDTFDE